MLSSRHRSLGGPLGAVLAAVLAMLCLHADGEVADPAVTAVTGGVAKSSPDYVVGWAFQVDLGITVTHLGVFDENGNAILDEALVPEVGLWDSAGALLASVAVPLETAAEDGFFYAAVSPVTLVPGSYVLGGVNFEGGESYRMGADLSTDARIEWIAGRFAASSELVFPTESRTTPGAFLGPNFKLQTALFVVHTPTNRSVRQRDRHNYADIAVSGTATAAIDFVDVEAVPVEGSCGSPVERRVLDAAPSGDRFAGILRLKAGRYTVTVTAVSGGSDVAATVIDRVGVGEVFVTAGQSNSANHGEPPQSPVDDRVSCFDTVSNWRHAYDPQPVATGTGGSPWPALGDALAAALDVPVGLASVGVGGSRVDQWLPGGDLYPRLEQALTSLGPNNCRAVLWHQGESDALAGTAAEVYAQRLESVIAQSRVDAGFTVPWGVAIVSWLPYTSEADQAQVRAGQQQVIDADPAVFLGSETDTFHTLGYLADGVHYNAEGLTAHGVQWAQRVRAYVFPRPSPAGRITGFVRVGPDTLRIEWDAEAGVTYEVQSTSVGVPGAEGWQAASDWVVGPENAAVVHVPYDATARMYRVAAPHTEP